MQRHSRLGRKVGSALVTALLIVGSCRDQTTAPTTPPAGSAGSQGLFGFSSPTLLSCPTNETQSTSALIDQLGGTLSLGANSVVVPLGALLGPTTVELTVPASRLMEVDLTVNGGQHISFLQPVVVTIDYSRCGRSNLWNRQLSVWNIDPSTDALLENMGGLDNKLTQTITFVTPHFSGFAIAY
jgi:hypothetical protein